MFYRNHILVLLLIIASISCKEHKNENLSSNADVPKKSEKLDILVDKPENLKSPEGMVWIPGGIFMQGALEKDTMAMNHERPAHPVAIDGFFMDISEVTNSEFQKFVDETGYITVAERPIVWEELKKQLPQGTPKPPDSILQPGSLTFKKTNSSVPNLYDYSQWWNWTVGASWKHPQGPDTSIENKGDNPVVHIAFEDAKAYCEWANRRLPTEAEWEYAARAGQTEAVFSWGSDHEKLNKMANSWEGEFPTSNTKQDGFEGIAPVKSFPANPFGLHDMAGNVWEYTNDWYNVKYYNEVNEEQLKNPLGAKSALNPHANTPEKIIKGGSYLCNASYCASYRISARMANSLDSSQEHLGFRTVADVKMIENEQ